MTRVRTRLKRLSGWVRATDGLTMDVRVPKQLTATLQVGAVKTVISVPQQRGFGEGSSEKSLR